MRAGELLHRRLRRCLAQQIGEALLLQRAQHRTQPVGAFRMMLSRIMPEAGRVGDQGGRDQNLL
jgi:hypothetical protein